MPNKMLILTPESRRQNEIDMQVSRTRITNYDKSLPQKSYFSCYLLNFSQQFLTIQTHVNRKWKTMKKEDAEELNADD